MVRCVFLSDTHNRHQDLSVPEGDVLVHCGDFTSWGSVDEIQAFGAWVRQQPHAYKVGIPGNHDLGFQADWRRFAALVPDMRLLDEEEVVVAGLRIWGSPWTPLFYNWAFNYPRGSKSWGNIPEGLDILITHGPPLGIGDLTSRGDEVGCPVLLERVREKKPKIHAFGHIHEGRGTDRVVDGVRFLNVSSLNGGYRPYPEACVVVDL